jgi:hypothetical protein
MSDDRRPRLDDILGGGRDDFNNLWDSTPAADEFEPVPPGRYKALFADGKPAESKEKRTPSYKVKFEVIEPIAFAGRKLFLDLWLTPKALAATKRDLAKLRIVSRQQLDQAPPTGIIVDLRVALRTADDGKQYNQVVGFTVIGKGMPPGTLDPDPDELADDASEGDSRDAGNFDWQAGVQH